MSVLTETTPALDSQERAAVAVCREITRTRAGNFYWGLRLTPEPKRSAMYAIYAWMREADDIVDDPTADQTSRAARVDAFRDQTCRALAGERCSAAPLWVALSAVARDYPLDASDFHGMLDGQIADVHPRQLGTWQDLRTYCCQVAGTVGSVCVAVWGQRDPRSLRLAVDRGIAFQLTNILRDVVEDIERGRVYIPAEDFERAGISAQDLVRWSNPDACASLLQGTISRAREHFVVSAPLDQMITSSCRPTLWAMTEVYRQLLESIARDPSQVVRGRVSLSTPRKLWIALRARTLGGTS